MTNSVVAKPNGAAAVDNYTKQVAQVQKSITDMTTRLAAAQAKLTTLQANPVVLHAETAAK
jgi:prefoldin subunit 5